MTKIHRNIFLIALYLIISYLIGYFLINEHWFVNMLLGLALTVFLSYIISFIYLVIKILKIL